MKTYREEEGVSKNKSQNYLPVYLTKKRRWGNEGKRRQWSKNVKNHEHDPNTTYYDNIEIGYQAKEGR